MYLIIFLARKLKVSPFIASLILMGVLTILFASTNSEGWQPFQQSDFLLKWMGICAATIGWVWFIAGFWKDGEYRKHWFKKDFWQK